MHLKLAAVTRLDVILFNGQVIEAHHRFFGLGGYFMAAAFGAVSYSRGGFSPCLALSARRVMVPGGSTFQL